MADRSIIKATFSGSNGDVLAARLDLPAGPIRAFALFAHCFTCTKDVLAARHIAAELAQAGVGVLRFDFTGLGASEGEFANTHFSSNVADLVLAADYLRQNYAAPALLVGHSLGGAAVLAAASSIVEAKAVVTIGSPYDVAHVLHQFSASIDDIRANGELEVKLAGRPFKIRREFIDDAQGYRLDEKIRTLGKALLVMHAPTDATVGIDNASHIFLAARHPKSFVTLDGADHLLSNPHKAAYAARVIAAWAAPYIPEVPLIPQVCDHVVVRETGAGRFQNIVISGRHHLMADEPTTIGASTVVPIPTTTSRSRSALARR